jgi:hypothetical protein
VDERRKEHLKHLNKYYLLLVDIRQRNYAEFEKDSDKSKNKKSLGSPQLSGE